MLDLVFLHCNYAPHCTARVDKHFEGYHTLQLVTRGAVEVFYDEKHYELRADESKCWFWPAFPGPRIRFHPARDAHEWEHRYAAFTGSLVSYWKNAGLWLTTPEISPRGGKIAEEFDRLLGFIGEGSPWSKRRAINQLEAILLELAQARAATSGDEEWLQTTREFLSQTQDFAPNYEALARQLGMGLSTLRRKFKTTTGFALHDAFLQNRLNESRRLLGETDLPLKQIAAQLGYKDVYFFSKQFKTLSGVSPGVYRRSRQG